MGLLGRIHSLVVSREAGGDRDENPAERAARVAGTSAEPGAMFDGAPAEPDAPAAPDAAKDDLYGPEAVGRSGHK